MALLGPSPRELRAPKKLGLGSAVPPRPEAKMHRDSRWDSSGMERRAPIWQQAGFSSEEEYSRWFGTTSQPAWSKISTPEKPVTLSDGWYWMRGNDSLDRPCLHAMNVRGGVAYIGWRLVEWEEYVGWEWRPL